MVVIRKQMNLGEKLLQKGLITIDQLEVALKEQQLSKERLGEILIKMGFMTQAELLPVLAEHMGVMGVLINPDEIDSELMTIISEDMMRDKVVFPVRKKGNKLTLAMANPSDVFLVDELQLRTKYVIKPVLAFKENIFLALDRWSEQHADESNEMLESAFAELEEMNVDLDVIEDTMNFEDSFMSDSAPIVKGVNAIISKAVKIGASDIHIEPYEKEVRIRYRVDGVLSTIKKIPKKVLNAFVSRLKIISDLDIAEKRLPQDGRFKIKMANRQIDFRVSTMPTVYGEKIVMRILDKGSVSLNLHDLGMEPSILKKVTTTLKSPYGMVLVTGPTGSGKSTSLYSSLNLLNNESVNISTTEDPVEYELQGINQVHCKSEIGLDFATSLRTFLRQDPDIIMVGEIRDKETAEISVKAALTGHLLLSTLHTNDAPSTIQRLTNMGIEPFMISASLLMIQAQRLMRRVCPHCKEKTEVGKELFLALGLDPEKEKEFEYYVGRGCEHCNGTGYKGRTAIYEIMFIDDKLRDLIADGAVTKDIREAAIEGGMVTLREDAIRKAREGITSLEEVIRVTME